MRTLNPSFSPTPAVEAGEGSLSTYLRAVRDHWRLVALVTFAALVGSLLVIAINPREYEATAEILISPLGRDDDTFIGLDLLRDSGDPTRNVQTAAALLDSPEAAERTARRLGGGFDGTRILRAVRVEPQGESNVLDVTATAEDPELAARVANTFAMVSLELRQNRLQSQLDALIEQLEDRRRAEALAPDGGGEATTTLAERLSQLEGVRAAGNDPTLSLLRSSEPATSAVGAAPWMIVAAALLAGLTLGTVAALAMRLLDRRIRDQEELATLYPVPLLAGVPQITARDRRGATELPAEAFEAFRTLATQVQSYGTGRSILMTSASSGDGKTTAAANLALALVEAGRKVVLFDLDVRKPELSEAVMGSRADTDEHQDDARDRPIVQSLRDPRIVLLPAAAGSNRESLGRRVSQLLPAALNIADYAIIDSSPLGEVSDALPVATRVDDVILVVRPRHTDRASFQVARDLLQRSGVVARGMLLVGEALHQTSSAYYMRAMTGSREAPTPAGAEPSGPG